MERNQILALTLLSDHPKGLFGSDFVELSSGKLSRLTVYTVLEALVDSGCISEIEVRGDDGRLPRTRHLITDRGRRALYAAQQEASSGGALPAST